MARQRNCSVCINPHREFIEAQLAKGMAYRQIIAEVNAKGGGSLSLSTISYHKNHVVVVDPFEESQAQLVEDLHREMAMAPPTVQPLYMVLIRQLDGIKGMKPSADSVIKAATAIAQITGMRQQQALLLAYADRAFNAGSRPAPTPVPATTVRRALEPGRPGSVAQH